VKCNEDINGKSQVLFADSLKVMNVKKYFYLLVTVFWNMYALDL
jgi:hypothetical protein